MEQIETALSEAGLTAAFHERPAYQQREYVSWIEQAERAETRAKRLEQTLTELRAGGVYMGMPHRPSER